MLRTESVNRRKVLGSLVYTQQEPHKRLPLLVGGGSAGSSRGGGTRREADSRVGERVLGRFCFLVQVCF